MKSNFLPDWRLRGLVHNVAAEQELAAHLAGGSRSIYCGFDPTADSLHVGSLLPLVALRRTQLAGHRPIVLVGGGTGLIGDPSGKQGERTLNAAETVETWTKRLKEQVGRFLDFDSGQRSAILADNYTWLANLSVLAFLRDAGKHFAVGMMLGKDSVRTRLDRDGVGISFTEFSYMILQAYDYLVLARQYDCTLQIGGSDQWGNITAGMDLIRRVDGRPTYGCTLPLVTKADGTKFGKTESGTVWLDPSRTSPYEMYQFWLNAADEDVSQYLRYFTFLAPSELEELARAHAASPENREAHRALAAEVTALVHGKAAVSQAQRISEALFRNAFEALTASDLEEVCKAAPHTDLQVAPASLVDLLVATGTATSRTQARELVRSGAIALNGKRVSETASTSIESEALHGRFVVLRKGKKAYHIARLPT